MLAAGQEVGVSDCASVISSLAQPADVALAPDRFWAGAWKDVQKRQVGARVCAELVKAKAHIVARFGEPPEERLARLANQWADEEAKAGTALQP